MSPSRTPPSAGPELLSVSVPANSLFVRIHQIKDTAHWFGPKPGSPPSYRFDAPAGQYRTLYAAEHLEGAFAETILRRANRVIPRAYVELRQWSVFSNSRVLKLLKLFDEGLVWHGVTADICTGDDYSGAQCFAAQLHSSVPDLDGIAYRARHNNGQICFALFDRISSVHLPIIDSRHFADERGITDDLMRKHNASWDPGTPLPLV